MRLGVGDPPRYLSRGWANGELDDEDDMVEAYRLRLEAIAFVAEDDGEGARQNVSGRS